MARDLIPVPSLLAAPILASKHDSSLALRMHEMAVCTSVWVLDLWAFLGEGLGFAALAVLRISRGLGFLAGEAGG